METVKIMLDGKEKDIVIKLDESTLNDDTMVVFENDVDLEDTVDLSNKLEKTMEVDIDD